MTLYGLPRWDVPEAFPKHFAPPADPLLVRLHCLRAGHAGDGCSGGRPGPWARGGAGIQGGPQADTPCGRGARHVSLQQQHTCRVGECAALQVLCMGVRLRGMQRGAQQAQQASSVVHGCRLAERKAGLRCPLSGEVSLFSSSKR